MDRYSAYESAALNKLDFYWNETSNEFFSDANEDEMGVYRECHDQHFVLRIRAWNDESCQYEDDYEHFSNIDELINYLT